MLAAAASSLGHHTSSRDEARPTVGEIGLNRLGPFNATAMLTPKVAKKILELEYVEMSDITLDAPLEPEAGRSLAPSRPPVTSNSQWEERYAKMAALLSTTLPQKAPELFPYMATVVRVECNYKSGRWVHATGSRPDGNSIIRLSRQFQGDIA